LTSYQQLQQVVIADNLNWETSDDSVLKPLLAGKLLIEGVRVFAERDGRIGPSGRDRRGDALNNPEQQVARHH